LFIGGALLLDEGRRRYEIVLAATLVIAVGHIGYTLVPGLGPCASPELAFDHALIGGEWWRRVNGLVSAAGAQLDIFPSLHTALSLSVGMHALRHRRAPLFRLLWPLIVFFVVNIVVATMFLRWHYGVDVIAGALLAWAAQCIAIAAFRHEGERNDRQAVWEPVTGHCYAATHVRGRAHALEHGGHDRSRAARARSRA
jgi:membrane-associated phospholipid phosphatase